MHNWLIDLDDGRASRDLSSIDATRTDKQAKALEAIEAMGEEAIPLLLQMIQEERPPLLELTEDAGNAIVEWASGGRSTLEKTTDADVTRWKAALALEHLAPKHAEVRTELVRLFTVTNRFAIREIAFALGNAHPEGIAALTNSITTGLTKRGSLWMEMCAVWSLSLRPAAAKEALPLLMEIAGKTNSPALAFYAIDALGNIGSEAAIAIPILEQQTNNLFLKQEAERALKKIKAAE
ncbi:MAG: hypothetical protein H0X66_18755 [Verrucomicrobia bacterium]|nr:hypothetical protein [Verrucomicrobiota bacterium]